MSEEQGCGKKCNCPTKREHWLSIGVSASAMPTRKPQVISQEDTVRNVDKNRNAYARLKKDGLQPKSVMTAAKMEARAESALEIQTGSLFGKHQSMAADVDALSKEAFAPIAKKAPEDAVR